MGLEIDGAGRSIDLVSCRLKGKTGLESKVRGAVLQTERAVWKFRSVGVDRSYFDSPKRREVRDSMNSSQDVGDAKV